MAILQKLNDGEIEDVVNQLPKFLAASAKVADKMREEVKNKLRLQLKDIEIVKTDESINKLKRMIVNQHYNSLVPPGEPVGIRAAEAMSQPTTQTALNAFHSAGSSSSSTVASGIGAIRELYDAAKQRNVENCKIHFKNKDLTFEDIIDIRRKFVGVTVASILSKKEYKTYTQAEEPWWYSLYADVNNNVKYKKVPVLPGGDETLIFLRLHFKTLNLYEYNITLTDIANKLDNRGIICIPSPTHMGMIDIFIDSNIVTPVLAKTLFKRSREGYAITSDIDNTPLLFLQIAFVPRLSEIVVNGVPGITQIFPCPEPVSIVSFIDKEEQLSNGVYRIHIDTLKMILEGLPINKLYKVMELCNYDIIRKEKNFIDIVQKDNLKATNKTPKTFITEKVKDEKALLEKKYEEIKLKEKYPRHPTSELLRAATYMYAVSNGTNLSRLLSHPDVDPQTTISTNPHEVLKTLGIEAARNFLIKSYIDIVEANDEYVNARHVMIVADYQTSRGILSPITSKGSAQQNSGTLAKASFEEPMPAFIDAAVFGKSEEIKNTSTSIFVGKRMIMGTGAFKSRVDKEALERAERIRKEYRAANPEKFSGFSDSEQLAFANNLISDEDLLSHSDDTAPGEKETVQTVLIGTEDTTITRVHAGEPELRFLNPVPGPIISVIIPLPSFVMNIVKPTSIFDGDVKKLSKSNITLLPAKVANSISKPGLPALAKMTPSQIVSSANPQRIVDMSLDDIDELDSDLDY